MNNFWIRNLWFWLSFFSVPRTSTHFLMHLEAKMKLQPSGGQWEAHNCLLPSAELGFYSYCKDILRKTGPSCPLLWKYSAGNIVKPTTQNFLSIFPCREIFNLGVENGIQGNLWKPCGCHLEGAGSGWAPRLALLPIPPLPQPQLCSPLCLSLFQDATEGLSCWDSQTPRESLPLPSVTLEHVLEDLPMVSACSRKPFPFHTWVMVVFSYPRQERHKSFTATSSQFKISNQPSPSAFPLYSSSSSCLSDLSLPAHHS